MKSFMLLFFCLVGLALCQTEISQNDPGFKAAWSWYTTSDDTDFMDNVGAIQHVYTMHDNNGQTIYGVFFAASNCGHTNMNCDVDITAPTDGHYSSQTTCRVGVPYIYPVPISPNDPDFKAAWAWYLSPAGGNFTGKAGTIQHVFAYNQVTPISKNVYEVLFSATHWYGYAANCEVTLLVKPDGKSYKLKDPDLENYCIAKESTNSSNTA